MSASPAPAQLLRVEVDHRGTVTVAKLIGSANMVVAGDLKDRLLELVESSPKCLVLDLSQLEFISSVGLGGIIAAHLRSRHHHGVIKLAAPRPEIRELLTVTNLTRLFPVCDSVESALAGLPD